MRDGNLERTIGRIVLFPIRCILAVVLIALLPVIYPLGVAYVLIRGEGDLRERAKLAFLWPLGLLAFNEFLSLGGLNNPTLSRINGWLERKLRPRHDK